MSKNVVRPIGADPARVDVSPAFDLLERLDTSDGKEYIYAQANGAMTGLGSIAVIDQSTGKATELTTVNGAAKYGWIVGVEPAVMADTNYGWFQVRGPASVQCAAAVAAGVRLNSTATSGAVDDDATVGACPIDGLSLTTAAVGAGLSPASLFHPKIGVTL